MLMAKAGQARAEGRRGANAPANLEPAPRAPRVLGGRVSPVRGPVARQSWPGHPAVRCGRAGDVRDGLVAVGDAAMCLCKLPRKSRSYKPSVQ